MAGQSWLLDSIEVFNSRTKESTVFYATQPILSQMVDLVPGVVCIFACKIRPTYDQSGDTEIFVHQFVCKLSSGNWPMKKQQCSTQGDEGQSARVDTSREAEAAYPA